MSGAGREDKDRGKRTPLLVACARGDLQCVKVLVGAGASLDARDKDANGVLHCAAGVLQPLYSSSASRSVAVLEWLCRKFLSRSSSKRCGINSRNKKLDSPLLVATRAGYVDAVMCLLQSGADPTCVNLVGEDAICIAARAGLVLMEALGAMMSSNHKGRAISRSGPAGGGGGKGKTPERHLCPLVEAVRSSNIESVSVLVLCGADATETSAAYHHMTALMFACQQCDADMVRVLLSSGSRRRTGVNAVDRDGLSAVCHAFIGGSTACVEQLLAHDPYCVKYCNPMRDNENAMEAVLRHSQKVPAERKVTLVQSLPLMIRYGCPVTARFIGRVCGLHCSQDSQISPRKGTASSRTQAALQSPCYSRGLPLPDVIINCAEGERLTCHSFLLSMHSSKLRSKLHELGETETGLERAGKELHMEAWQRGAVESFLDWMYAGAMTPSLWDADVQRVIQVLMLAHEFIVVRLQRLCEYRLWTLVSTATAPVPVVNQISRLANDLQLDHLKCLIQKSALGKKGQPACTHPSVNSDSLLPFMKCSPTPLWKAIRANAIGYGKTGIGAWKSDGILLEWVVHHRLLQMGTKPSHRRAQMTTLKQCLQRIGWLDISLGAVLLVLLDSDDLLANALPSHVQCRDPGDVWTHLRSVLVYCFASFAEFVGWVIGSSAHCPECEDKGIGSGKSSVNVAVIDFVSDDLHRLMCQHLPLFDMSLESCDMCILCDEGRSRQAAHRAILTTCSSKLASLIHLRAAQGNWDGVLHLPELSAVHCHCIVSYAYTGNIPWSLLRNPDGNHSIATIPIEHGSDEDAIAYFDKLSKLLMLADEYLMDDMKGDAEQMLISILTPENCHAAIAVAHYTQCFQLMKTAAALFLTHYHSYLDHYNAIVNSERTAGGREEALDTLSQLNETCECALSALIL